MSDFSSESTRPWPKQFGESDQQLDGLLEVTLQPLDDSTGEVPAAPDAILLMQAPSDQNPGEDAMLSAAWSQEMATMPEEARGLLVLGQKAVEAAQWAANHKIATLIGVAVLSGIALDPGGSLHEALPVALVWGGGEVLWNVGAGMCVVAVNKRVPRSWTELKRVFNDLDETASQSTLFKGGLAVNTLGAVIQGTIPTAIIMTNSPPEAWGKVTPFLLDLGITVAVRTAIARVISRKQQP